MGRLRKSNLRALKEIVSLTSREIDHYSGSWGSGTEGCLSLIYVEMGIFSLGYIHSFMESKRDGPGSSMLYKINRQNNHELLPAIAQSFSFRSF